MYLFGDGCVQIEKLPVTFHNLPYLNPHKTNTYLHCRHDPF